MQEVFIAARAALPRYDPTRPAAAWLAGIARGVLSNWRARVRPQREVVLPTEELEQMQGLHEAAAQERVLEAKDNNALLYRLLDEVEFESRVVVVMHDITGSEMKDIVRELDVPATTGYWRLKNGRAELKAAAERARARDPRVWGALLPVPFDAASFLKSHSELPDPPASARARIWEALQRTPAQGEPSGPRAARQPCARSPCRCRRSSPAPSSCGRCSTEPPRLPTPRTSRRCSPWPPAPNTRNPSAPWRSRAPRRARTLLLRLV